MGNNTKIPKMEGLQFSLNDAISALKVLSLNSVTLGDYLVVLNNREDVTVCAEPYLALQLWLNFKSGKVMNRVWSQTVACDNIVNIGQFVEACANHFSRLPCLGRPLKCNEKKTSKLVIYQVPFPRKASVDCQKVVGKGSGETMNTCKECKKLQAEGVVYSGHTNEDEDFDEDPVAAGQVHEDKNQQLKIEDGFEGDSAMNNLNQGLFHDESGSKKTSEKLTRKFEDRSFLSRQVKLRKKVTKYKNRPGGLQDPLNAMCVKCIESSNPCKECLKVKNNSVQKDSYKAVGKALECDQPVATGKNQGDTNQQLKMEDDCGSENLLNKSNQDLCSVESSNTGAKYRPRAGARALGFTRGPMDVECDICGSICTAISYRSHMKDVHGEKSQGKVKKCPWCEKVTSVNQLARHARLHHFWGRFTCSECPFMGDFSKNIVQHVMTMHPKETSIRCPSCKQQSLLNVVESHYKECITEKHNEVRQNSNLNSKSRVVCDLCGKSLARGHYNDHFKNYHTDTQVEYFYCDKCSKKYKQRSALNCHIRQAHNNITFTCSKCDITFDTKAKLYGHQNIVHSTAKEFECQHCGMRCRNVATLRKHETTHEAPQFQCRHCPKKLTKEIHLIAHERYHTGDKPFKCSECPNEYVSKHGLRQHMRGVHKISVRIGAKLGWKRKQK